MFNDKIALILALVILGAGWFWFILKQLDAYRIKTEIERRIKRGE